MNEVETHGPRLELDSFLNTFLTAAFIEAHAIDHVRDHFLLYFIR